MSSTASQGPPRLAHLDRTNLTADRRDGSYNFMTRNERIMADSPIVCNQVQIAVANPAVRNGDLNFLQTQLSWVIVVRQEFRPAACAASP